MKAPGHITITCPSCGQSVDLRLTLTPSPRVPGDTSFRVTVAVDQDDLRGHARTHMEAP